MPFIRGRLSPSRRQQQNTRATAATNGPSFQTPAEGARLYLESLNDPPPPPPLPPPFPPRRQRSRTGTGNGNAAAKAAPSSGGADDGESSQTSQQRQRQYRRGSTGGSDLGDGGGSRGATDDDTPFPVHSGMLGAGGQLGLHVVGTAESGDAAAIDDPLRNPHSSMETEAGFDYHHMPTSPQQRQRGGGVGVPLNVLPPVDESALGRRGGGKYTWKEQLIRQQQLAADEHALPGGERANERGGYLADPNGGGGIYPSSSSASSDAVEWTPHDSSYGAACPVCGWVPKRIRRMVEATLLVVMVIMFVFLIVKLLTPLTIFHNDGGSNSSSTSHHSDSGSGRITDDDYYVEIYKNDDDSYANDDLLDDDANADDAVADDAVDDAVDDAANDDAAGDGDNAANDDDVAAGDDGNAANDDYAVYNDDGNQRLLILDSFEPPFRKRHVYHYL